MGEAGWLYSTAAKMPNVLRPPTDSRIRPTLPRRCTVGGGWWYAVVAPPLLLVVVAWMNAVVLLTRVWPS